MGFDAILTHTLQNEGGVTTDTGGLTNYGITQNTYGSVDPALGRPNKSVKDLKYGEVKKVYESEFYKKPNIDKIPSEKVQGVLFDWGVNAGTGTAIKKLQARMWSANTLSDGLSKSLPLVSRAAALMSVWNKSIT